MYRFDNFKFYDFILRMGPPPLSFDLRNEPLCKQCYIIIFILRRVYLNHFKKAGVFILRRVYLNQFKKAAVFAGSLAEDPAMHTRWFGSV